LLDLSVGLHEDLSKLNLLGAMITTYQLMMFKLIISLTSLIILKLGLRSLAGFMTSHVVVGLRMALSLDIGMTVSSSFDYGYWDGLNVEDKVVVDVGAFIGDSSIYFVLRGASGVIAVEPHPEAYKVMVENIRLNGLEDVITPVNASLSSRPGVTCIKNVDVEGTYGTYHGLGECDTAVPVITLADLIDKYNVGRDAVLKMDCEGCEYDVILNDYEHVKLFNEIAFEYHEGATGKLLKVLVRDYNCSHVARYSVVYCTRKRV
jgi:FkbM family methyltransferase